MVGSSIINNIISNYPSTRIRGVYHYRKEPFIKDERVEYVYGDLRNKEDCMRVVKGCDCAIMAAANTGGAQYSTSRPWEQMGP